MPRLTDVCACRFCPPKNSGFQSFVGLIVLVLCLSGSLSNSAYARGATATLIGVVKDENEAVIGGANSAVINLAQDLQGSTTTNDEGTFVVPLLPPGNHMAKTERRVQPRIITTRSNHKKERG